MTYFTILAIKTALLFFIEYLIIPLISRNYTEFVDQNKPQLFRKASARETKLFSSVSLKESLIKHFE